MRYLKQCSYIRQIPNILSQFNLEIQQFDLQGAYLYDHTAKSEHAPCTSIKEINLINGMINHHSQKQRIYFEGSGRLRR